MEGNIRVGNLFGIPFYVNPSWFLILALVTISYGGQLATLGELGGLTPWILGLIAALLLFASVVAHELGHSFVAMFNGIGVNSITLFLFGGLASLEKEAKTPWESFLIAIAGPVVSLVLFAVFTWVGVNLNLPTPIAAIISLLASVNLVLGIFNLIPGLPLDGGNILKSIVWQITGNSNRGIIFASRVGQIFGWTAIALGVLSLFGVIQFGSIWTLLIGFFLLQNAGMSAQSAKIQETLSGYTAEEAIIPHSPIVFGSLTLREFVNDQVIGQRQWQKFLVVDSDKQLQGTLAIDNLKAVPTSQWNDVLVQDLVTWENDLKTVTPSESLLEVAKLLEMEKIAQLTVISEAGEVLGLLEKSSVIELLQKQNKQA